MRIAFITASSLPMPPVNGGAVENLIDIILNHNELNLEHEITVYSCKSEKALIATKKYMKTRFVYINTESLVYKTKKLFLYALNKYSGKYWGNAFIREVVKSISFTNSSFDAIIIENKPEYSIHIRKTYSGNLFLHLHNDLLNNKTKHARAIVSSLNGIFTVSNFIRNRVLTIDQNKTVHTVYNGIDTEVFNHNLYLENRDTMRQKYGFKSDDIILLFSGRLNEAKGIDKLLEAFVGTSKELNLKLLIVGSSIFGETKEDNFLAKLKQLAKNREKDIVFTGYVDYKEIPTIHAMSDIAVIPSVWDDPSPLTIYEAMSSGLPIITTDSGGIPELVNEKCASIIKRDENLVENLKEEIIKLATNIDLRKEMAIKSRIRGLNFSKDKYTRLLIEEIKSSKNADED